MCRGGQCLPGPWLIEFVGLASGSFLLASLGYLVRTREAERAETKRDHQIQILLTKERTGKSLVKISSLLIVNEIFIKPSEGERTMPFS